MPTITESVIILPLVDNDGALLSGVHANLQAVLIQAFGGYTSAPVNGAWRDEATGLVYSEDSTEYRIAADWTSERISKRLAIIAANAAKDARQIAVYLRDGSGAVHYVSPAEPPRAREVA